MYQDPSSVWAYLAVAGAGIVAAVIGYIWYHPRVFGTAWMRYSGITPEMAERGKRRMPLHAFIGLLASMLIAYVMLGFGAAYVYDWMGALQFAFLCWIGFAAPLLIGSVIWEQKPLRLYLINALYWLVALTMMALILSL